MRRQCIYKRYTILYTLNLSLAERQRQRRTLVRYIYICIVIRDAFVKYGFVSVVQKLVIHFSTAQRRVYIYIASRSTAAKFLIPQVFIWLFIHAREDRRLLSEKRERESGGIEV